jgi:hemerythrin-like metal-binding protein
LNKPENQELLMKNTGVIEWDEGVDHPDDRHKELVRMVDTICCGINDGGGENFFRQSLFRLVRYLKYHLKQEEHFMKKADYPGIGARLKQRENFMSEMPDPIQYTLLEYQTLPTEAFIG